MRAITTELYAIVGLIKQCLKKNAGFEFLANYASPVAFRYTTLRLI